MIFCIITHVNHYHDQQQYFAYAPYVREMNIWLKHVEEVIIVAPCPNNEISKIDVPYNATSIDFRKVSSLELTSIKQTITTFFRLPKVTAEIFKAMKSADHIHLRCPGNMGLLGCLVQILFPSKKKIRQIRRKLGFSIETAMELPFAKMDTQ